MKVRIVSGEDFLEVDGGNEFVSWATREFTALQQQKREAVRVATVRHDFEAKATAMEAMRDAAMRLVEVARGLRRDVQAMESSGSWTR